MAEISPGHDAVLFVDDDEAPIAPRGTDDHYVKSEGFRRRWASHDGFWKGMMGYYSKMLGIIGVDLLGAIYHIDHLSLASNAAFDEGKALPLLDCAAEHPPPCNQISKRLQTSLDSELASLTETPALELGGSSSGRSGFGGLTTKLKKIQRLLNQTRQEGELCGVRWGCRHFWYPGPAGHALRGDLVAGGWPPSTLSASPSPVVLYLLSTCRELV